MIKSYIVDVTCNDMRLDRWIRHKLGNIPQSHIEKNLRSGKIKVNKKKQKVHSKLKQVLKFKLLILNSKKI